MDPKLYKTLKQLVKLGIIGRDTKLVRRRKRKRRKKPTSIYQQQAQPSTHMRSTATTTPPTVSSEQAIINLKASELQLQRALQNKDLPDDSKQKVLQALEDIRKQQNIDKMNMYSFMDRKLGYIDDKNELEDVTSYYTGGYRVEEPANRFEPQKRSPTNTGGTIILPVLTNTPINTPNNTPINTTPNTPTIQPNKTFARPPNTKDIEDERVQTPVKTKPVPKPETQAFIPFVSRLFGTSKVGQSEPQPQPSNSVFWDLNNAQPPVSEQKADTSTAQVNRETNPASPTLFAEDVDSESEKEQVSKPVTTRKPLAKSTKTVKKISADNVESSGEDSESEKEQVSKPITMPQNVETEINNTLKRGNGLTIDEKRNKLIAIYEREGGDKNQKEIYKKNTSLTYIEGSIYRIYINRKRQAQKAERDERASKKRESKK